MDFRPKVQSTISHVNNTIEDVSCGCVMHRYKGYKRKRRWGQLRVEMNDNTARCIIRLFKHDLSNVNQDSSKVKEPKLKFEIQFSKEDFCGLEKGDHYDRHGMRRYVCIISKEKHLIIEDAVMTAAGINHNILGTWYQLISQVMGYVNRWKVIESDPKLANSKVCYLHVGSRNISECHSLEDKTRENRNCVVLRSWKCNDLDHIQERIVNNDGDACTDITFNVPDNCGNSTIVNMCVEGTPNLRQIVQQLNKTTTICSGFDDLNCSPNLVRIPRQNQQRGIRGMLTKTMSGGKGPTQDVVDMQQAKKVNRHSHGNLYVKLEKDKEVDNEDDKSKPPPYYNVQQPECIEMDKNYLTKCNKHANVEPSTSRMGGPCLHDSNPRIRVAPCLANPSSTRNIDHEPKHTPRHLVPPNGWHVQASPPQLPSPGFDDNDLKKGPSLATQKSFDSDYQTGDNLSTVLTESDFQGRYVNLQRGNSDSDSLPNGSLPRRPSDQGNIVYQNLVPDVAHEDQPPALPARDEQPPVQPYENIINRPNDSPLLQNHLPRTSQPPPRPPKQRPLSEDTSGYQNMLKETNDINLQAPPLPERQVVSDDDTPRPRIDPVALAIQQGILPPLDHAEGVRAYENSIAFEISINEVLQGTHLNNSSGRWLDLPHSVFVKIALGLEKEGVTVDGWRAFAEKLGLTFKHVQQLSGLMRIHPTLRPVEVLLLHWSRTQYPIAFTRENLQALLVQIGRDDLAHIIPSEQNQCFNNGDNG